MTDQIADIFTKFNRTHVIVCVPVTFTGLKGNFLKAASPRHQEIPTNCLRHQKGQKILRTYRIHHSFSYTVSLQLRKYRKTDFANQKNHFLIISTDMSQETPND